MKKVSAVILILICFVSSSCWLHHNGNINLSFSESEQYYSMEADFNRNRTREVEDYMNRKFGHQNNFSFTNTNTNATLTLNDNTKFYMKKYPGHLEIEFNKEENSDEAYYHIKSMCEGMKKILAH